MIFKKNGLSDSSILREKKRNRSLSMEEVLKEKERHDKLLEIPGVMISDVEVREYPLGEAAAHLVEYVQSVTAEDSEEHGMASRTYHAFLTDILA